MTDNRNLCLCIAAQEVRILVMVSSEHEVPTSRETTMRAFERSADRTWATKPSRALSLSLHLRGAFFFLILAYAFVAGQWYIASTLLGQRPRPAFHATGSHVSDLWSECASIVSTGLSDIGDAGATWLAHAYVGSNNPAPAISPASMHPRNRYMCRCLFPEVYAGKQPRLTAIVHSHNHRANIANISTALRSSSAVEEVVVCDDGSADGSLEEWHKSLPDSSHFVVRSNKLNELRNFNRAMRMSAGDIVVLLRDDDLLPTSDEWIKNAFRLFAEIPDLGVLGGYTGQLWDPHTHQGFEYGEQGNSQSGLHKGSIEPIQHIEPRSGIPFMFTECVWLAPLFIRRSLLRKAGGLELSIAKRGEPGVWQECVLSYEAWVNGFSVGVFNAPFERSAGGYSLDADEKLAGRVYERAVAYANRKYSRRRIHDYVALKNTKKLKPRTKI